MSGSTNEDRVISIATDELEDNKLKGLKKGLFNPGVPIKQGAFWVHKISDRDLVNKPDFKNTKFFKLLNDFLSDPKNIVVGHAVCNDLFVIAKEGIYSRCRIIDTQYCATKIFDTEKSSLNFLAKEYNLLNDENVTFHTAEGDVKVTYKLYLELLKHCCFEKLVSLSMEQFFDLQVSVDGRKKKFIYSIAAQNSEVLLPLFKKVKDPKKFYALMFFYSNSHLIHNKTKNEMINILSL